MLVIFLASVLSQHPKNVFKVVKTNKESKKSKIAETVNIIPNKQSDAANLNNHNQLKDQVNGETNSSNKGLLTNNKINNA